MEVTSLVSQPDISTLNDEAPANIDDILTVQAVLIVHDAIFPLNEVALVNMLPKVVTAVTFQLLRL